MKIIFALLVLILLASGCVSTAPPASTTTTSTSVEEVKVSVGSEGELANEIDKEIEERLGK